MLRNKEPAPDFFLRNEKSEEYSLTDLRTDKPLVIFFFRGAFCPTSARDLLSYSNAYNSMCAVGANLVAISVDEPDELHRLKVRLRLPFLLLSDPGFVVSHRYGVYESDET